MNNAELAHQLTECLELNNPPIALRFVQEIPRDIPPFDGTVTAGCAFWRQAEQGTFYTSALAHINCPIGVHTMGLPMLDGNRSGGVRVGMSNREESLIN